MNEKKIKRIGGIAEIIAGLSGAWLIYYDWKIALPVILLIFAWTIVAIIRVSTGFINAFTDDDGYISKMRDFFNKGGGRL